MTSVGFHMLRVPRLPIPLFKTECWGFVLDKAHESCNIMRTHDNDIMRRKSS